MMLQAKNKQIFVIGLLAVLIMGAAFFSIKRTSFEKTKLLIVCTTGMIADAVNVLAGEQFQVKALMGPGVDPHLYRARESDVHALSNADLIFYNGLHLEGKMGDLFAHMNRYVPTIAIAKQVPIDELIESDFEGIYDPHVWHDIMLWRTTIPLIRDELIKKDPSNKMLYKQRAQQYLAQLNATERYIKQQVAQIPPEKRILITAHDAFAYFGKRYGFEVVGLQGISTDAMVSARDIQQIADFIVNKKVRSIFLEASIPSRSIEAVQKAVAARGWHLAIAPELFSDSLGDESTTADTYCDMLKHNIDVIVNALIS